MKKEVYTYPKSSFLSMEKDLNLIVNMIIKNERLKKMLHYTGRDCLLKPALTDDQTLELFSKNIKIVPKLVIDKEVLNYLFISFDTFTQNQNNPQFRDNLIQFDIVCHFDQWPMKDFELRPYKIAAELDSMFNNKHLTGIGTLQFLGAKRLLLSDEFGGISLVYTAIHGGEDKVKMPNPMDEEDFVANFDAIFNEK